jgi:N-acyl-D-aspartate/D-glutamate deacylase
MERYDVVFRNVEVFDGTGKESFFTDVCLKDGKIAQVSCTGARAAEEIDGENLSLAPGFIDVHTHSDTQLFPDPSRMCKLTQGVTSEIGGQCGWSRGPADPGIPEDGYEYLKAANNGGSPLTLYPDYNELLAAISHIKLGANQMVFVGHHVLRASTVGMENRKPTQRELSRMKELLECAMQEGAPGLSTGLVYAPGCYSTTEELIELSHVVAQYNGIYTTHMRNEADGVLDSVREVIRIAKETGVSVNISHLKAMYRKNLPKLAQALELIDQACAEGCDITFDVYPYEASSATILSTLPPSYLSHGMQWLMEELSSPEGIDRLEKAILEPTEVWDNPLLNAGFDKDVITIANATPEAAGKSIHEIALEKGMRDVEAYAYLITANKGSVTDIRYTMFEESLAGLYKHQKCMVGTDGLYYGGKLLSHPRAFGTFPRYLGRFVREQKILPFPEAIRRLTGMPAERYRLAGKGFIREGYDADLVLFNKETIIDQATYQNPFLPNIGIKMVFVSGQAAVVHNMPTGVLNGKTLKWKV